MARKKNEEEKGDTEKAEKPKKEKKKEKQQKLDEISTDETTAAAPEEEKPKKTKKTKTEEPPKEKEIVEVYESDVGDVGDENVDLENLPKKWWLEEPWRSLLDPNLVKTSDALKYDLSGLINQFTEKMLQEDYINFRISGIAVYSAAKMHHWKIKDVIDEEEKIQEKEIKERTQREIPKTIAQPLRESRKIATQEELFGALKFAILETMQQRERLKIKREEKLAQKQEQKVIRTEGRLPPELLKHILGKEETIEDLKNFWLNKIITMYRLGGERSQGTGITYNELMTLIDEEQNLPKEVKKMKEVKLFEVLMFLTSDGKIALSQEDFDKDIYIKPIGVR